MWNGANLTFLYYFVITPGDKPLDNTVVPQAIFTAVRECCLLISYDIIQPVC